MKLRFLASTRVSRESLRVRAAPCEDSTELMALFHSFHGATRRERHGNHSVNGTLGQRGKGQ